MPGRLGGERSGRHPTGGRLGWGDKGQARPSLGSQGSKAPFVVGCVKRRGRESPWGFGGAQPPDKRPCGYTAHRLPFFLRTQTQFA